ncbi:MAG: VCBS repeat-containing protein [Archangium sp.]|nr:VCBS repeat-containing protein [Archangium sp.]
MAPVAEHRLMTARGWESPTRKDPRIPFASLLVLYAVMGFTFLGFNRQWWQMALIVGSGCALEVVLSWLFSKRKIVPLSALISCTSLGILLNYSHHSWVLFFPVFLAIGSKYLLTFNGRHVFNPSMFGVAMSLLLSRELITAAPAYQWAGGSFTMSIFIATGALMLFMFRVGRGPLVISFLLLYAVQTAIRAYIMRHHLPWQTLFLGTLESPPFFLFTFYMITDPATSPKDWRWQIALAFGLCVVDGFLHFKESVYTFFYAALTIGTGRFLFIHLRELYRGRVARLKALFDFDSFRRVALVGGLGVAMLGAWNFVLAPLDKPADPGFRLEPVTLAHSGLGSTMGKTLEEVDPRLQHVAKWILSVGDAVGSGDVNGDGKLDLVITHPLAVPGDRVGLYLNKGDFQFERVPLPALESLMNDPWNNGMAGGAVLIDDDGDGDDDLLVPVAFGQTRLLRNRRIESGALSFEDVTGVAGLGAHTVSLGATFFDFDNDGALDLYVMNALTTHLPGYDNPRPLNVFKLPAPEYPDDRRALRFMHNGWHDADNGGKNQLYKGNGDGTYTLLDIDAFGMPDTRWSLAVGTQDWNKDGFTDLYVANDFGPDDLYLNEGGKHFRRITSARFGDIGRDTYKGMNCSVADFDHNGFPDVYVSNVHHSLQSEGSLLWMVSASDDPFVPSFIDEATQRGALNERRFAWGAAAGDLNLDGWDDLVQANGMLDDRLDKRELNTRRRDYWYVNQKLMQSGPEIHTYADRWGDIRGRELYPNEARRAYLNQKDGTFVDVAQLLGIAAPDNSRGVLMADLDDDGDLDVLVTNQHAPLSLYRNTLRSPGVAKGPHFIGFSLSGTARGKAPALGTRVTVTSTTRGVKLEQSKELQVMAGFSGQAEPRLLFGLTEDAPSEVEVTIQWHHGAKEVRKLAIDRYHALTPGMRSER